MIGPYVSNLGKYLQSNHPGINAWAFRDASGQYWLENWRDQDGPPPTPEQVASWSGVTDLDLARQYAQANEAAEQIIFLLMARVSMALVGAKLCTSENVNEEGTKFVGFHQALINKFKLSGRHPDAGTELYNAIASEPSTTAFPWLLANGGAILAIFANGLPRNA